MNKLGIYSGTTAPHADSVENIIESMVRLCSQTTDVDCVHKIIQKATEYLRLCDTKGIFSGKGDICKPAVCVELAFMDLREAVDRTTLMSCSGVSARLYMKTSRMIQNALTVTPSVGIRELAVKFGAQETIKETEHKLNIYKTHFNLVTEGESLNSSMSTWTAAAFYQTCQQQDIKIKLSMLAKMMKIEESQIQKALEMISAYESRNINKKNKNVHSSLETIEAKTSSFRQQPIMNPNRSSSVDIETTNDLKSSRKRTKTIDSITTSQVPRDFSIPTTLTTHSKSSSIDTENSSRSLANLTKQVTQKPTTDSLHLKTGLPVPQIFYENLLVSLFGTLAG